MKKYVLAIILFLISIIQVYCNNEYEPNRIIIKFKAGNSVFTDWNNAGRVGSISQLVQFIGQHSTKGYLSNNFFDSKHIFDKIPNYNLSSTAKINSLNRIAIINFEKSLDLDQIIAKISKLDFLEYAEKMPIHHFCSITNDPQVDHQYYIPRVRAHLVWGDINYMDTITVAVIDTGIDYTHPDLNKNIYINIAETGTDDNGADKSKNGIDDDGNGFIDDYIGWDFANIDTENGDNNPKPGHLHGTHVAGIIGAITNNNIGIAGTAKNVKLLAVKIGYDDSQNTSTYREYEGIYYAALMGAKIINCSWGSLGSAKSENEIIQEVTQMGALVVAAGGNEYVNKKFYPGAYIDALSVAAINEYNKKPDFSNWGDYIDICAPGVDIWSTIPANNYKYSSGSSMASPIVAAVASIALMTHKSFNPLQISELLKLTADTTIYDIDTNYYIGTGCVDAYNAVNTKIVKSIILKNYQVTDLDNDGVFSKYDTFNLSLNLLNVLSPITNLKIIAKATDTSSIYVNFTKDTLLIDSMSTYQIIDIIDAFTFTLNDNIPIDYQLKIDICIYIDNQLFKTEYTQLLVNPSYIDIHQNNILLTVNSCGNLAFNNYPANTQGHGLKYKNSQNLLFEGSLMVATGTDKVSDVARSYASIPLRNFSISKIISDTVFADTGLLQAYTVYNDFKAEPSYGLLVRQYVFASNKPGAEDFIISTYNITNNSTENMDSVYLGLFFDWDIGLSGANNLAIYDRVHRFSYCQNAYNETLPLIGVKLISQQRENYYGISNNGSQAGIFGLNDGFTKTEKWTALSSGIVNDSTNKTDVSTVVSAGPIPLKVGQTATIVFSIFAADNYHNLVNTAQLSEEFYSSLNVSRLELAPKQINVYPNPIDFNNSKLELLIYDSNYYTILVHNYKGDLISKLFDNQYFDAGLYSFPFDSDLYSSGLYIISIEKSFKIIDSQIFSIIK